MAKTRTIQTAFTSGVLSPLLLGRVDLQQYYQGLELGDNVVLLPQGGLRRRAGTAYVDEALPIMDRNATLPTMPNGGTPADINDGDTSTSTTTTTNISTLDPYVIAQYDFGSAINIEYFDIRDLAVTGLANTTDEVVMQHSDDGASWTTFYSLSSVGSSARDFRIRGNVAKRYWRLVKIGGTDLGTNKFIVGEFAPYTKSSTLSEVKLKDFSVSTDRHYLFVITDLNCRIYKNDVYQADVPTPFLSSEVKSIRDVQSESVILLFHENHATVRITNLGTDTDWFNDLAPYINVPQADFNDSLSPTPVDEVQDITFNSFTVGQQFQIDVEGVLSKNITYAGDSSADEQSSTAENIRKNLQDMPNFGDTGIAVAFVSGSTFRITISGESTKAFELFSGFPTTGAASDNITFTKVATGSPRKEDVWSSARGWPKTACFYEGRLIIGGTRSKSQSVFASKAGLAFNFEIDESDDDDAIFATISSRELSEIVDVFPGRNLQIFAAGSEFSVLQSPITPQTFGIVPQTSHGSFNLEAKEIDGATLIVDRNGKTLREYVYNFNEDAYIANDISVLSPELIQQPKDLTILGGTQSDDANWIFIINADGTAAVLNTLRSQDINGFTRWTTSGELEDASTVNDQVYISTKRVVNGVVKRYIERWDFSYYVDSGMSFTYGSPTKTISGLDHLEGRVVVVRADGYDAGTYTVSGGSITLDTAASDVQVGLLFLSQFRSMPLATNVGSGINSNRLKKLVKMNLYTFETQGLQINGQQTPVKQFGEGLTSPLGNAPLTRTGIISDVYPSTGWERGIAPIISQSSPMPFTVLNIEYEVESS